MREPIPVNLHKEVCAITSVLIDPYRSFIRRLHADGRVTRTEMTKLNQLCAERLNRLADLVQKRLVQSRGMLGGAKRFRLPPEVRRKIDNRGF